VPGYLSHLAARVSGAKPAVRPRLPSIFEATPGAALPVVPDPVGLRVVEQETIAPQPVSRPSVAPTLGEAQATPVQPRSTPSQPHPAPLAPRRDESLEEVDALDRSTRSAQTPRQTLQPPIETLSVRDAPLSLHERVVARIEPRTVDSLQERQQPAPVPRPRTPQYEPEPPRVSRADAHQPLPLRAEHEAPRPERRQPEFEPALTAPVRTLTAPFVLQPEFRPVERFPAFPESREPQAPSVQVTIGRLIVEAVSPVPAAAPLPAPRPHAPRLSLDDYLRQRRSQA